MATFKTARNAKLTKKLTKAVEYTRFEKYFYSLSLCAFISSYFIRYFSIIKRSDVPLATSKCFFSDQIKILF